MADKNCGNCDWFALQPGKRRSGACLNRWMPKARYSKDACYGAYGRVFPWDCCDSWIEQGTIERYEPMMIGGRDG